MKRLEEAPVSTLLPTRPRKRRASVTKPWRPQPRRTGVNLLPTLPEAIATFAPAKYEPNYRYPLLVWLHEANSSEGELPVVMPHVSLQNLVAVAPRALDADAFDNRFNWSHTTDGVGQAEDAVHAAIEKAQRCFSVHPERVFVAGAGAGGAMALRLALRQPQWFAGAASIDGPLPRGAQLLSRLGDARRVPLLIASSRNSVGYPQPQLCEDLSLLHSAGIGVDVRQYPGDEPLTTEMLADLHRWIMSQFCV